MKKQGIIATAALWMLVAGMFVTAAAQNKIYQESGGLVIMEMENTPSPLGEWVLKTDNPGHNGDGFLEFTGNSINGGDPNSPLEFRFKINLEGTYDIKLRARKRLDGEPGDKCNDAYVRMEGDFTTGSASVSQEALERDTKLYGGPESGWGWAGDLDAHDADHTQARYVFKSGQEYRLIVSGRSIRYQIDRIVFMHTSANLEDAVSGPESQLVEDNPTETCEDPDALNTGEVGTCEYATVETIVLNALNDFSDITSGEVPFYKDNDRGALAIDAANESYRDKFAAATTSFTGSDGIYDITITALTELDGECIYRLSIGDQLIGEFQNPETNTDYQGAAHTWQNVEVKNGDIIKVESNTHTNGNIPEGGGTAWARGRWTMLTMELVGDPTYIGDEQEASLKTNRKIRYINGGLWLYGDWSHARSVELYNTQGIMVEELDMESVEAFTPVLEKGLYIVRTRGAHIEHIQKLMVQ
jgi:hypothetical protein